MKERRALFACDLDSQVFGALPLALAFAARGWQVTFAIESAQTLPKPVLERLAGQFGLIERAIGALPTDDEAFRHDAIGVFVTGSRLALFRHTLELAARVRGRRRPALFCGFNGLVFEKFEEGVAWRLGYDVIGLNGPRDRDSFVDFLHATDFAKQPSVIVGLRRKTDTPPRPLKVPPRPAAPEIDAKDRLARKAAEVEDTSVEWIEDAIDEAPPSEESAAARETEEDAEFFDERRGDEADADETETDEGIADGGTSGVPAASAGPRKLFVFAEQVVVPRTLRERQALIATLARIAKASPGWDVAIKARIRPDEQTFHSQPNHVSKLLKELRDKPTNLFVTYNPLDELLDRADLFATISSTALFDAFDYGVPSLVVTDFGLRNADGAHVFFASGLLVRLCDLLSLDDAPIQAPDARWMRRIGYGDPYSPAALVDWLDGFDPDRPMPRCFVSFEAAAGVASGSPERAASVCAAFAKVEDALAARAGRIARPDQAKIAAEGSDAAANETRATPDGELALLGFAITAALSPKAAAKALGKSSARNASSSRLYEGPVEAFSRRLGMYWIVKRTRQRLGLPIHAPRS